MVFISKYRGYKQWITPSRYNHNNFGERTFVAGEFVKFTDGRLEVNDPKIIEALMKNPVYGVDYWAIDDDNNVIQQENEQTKKTIEADKQATATTGPTACPECDFVAQSPFGLQSHLRAKHPKS